MTTTTEFLLSVASQWLREHAREAAQRFAPYYAASGWKWGEEEEEYVPDVDQIEALIRKAIARARTEFDAAEGSISTCLGGILVNISLGGLPLLATCSIEFSDDTISTVDFRDQR